MAKENKTIAKKMEELEERTNWFYSEDFELDKATENYKKAMELAREIEKDLNELKNKITVVEKDFTKD